MNSAVVGTTALAVIVLAAFVDDRETRVGPQDRGPALVLLDSIVLQETDDLYVGRAMSLFLGPDSSLFVVDPFANAIVRFGRNGRALRAYGGPGDGPGEFSVIRPVGFASRTVLVASDGRPPRVRIEFFDLESGESIGGATATSVRAFFLHGDMLWIGGMDTDANAPLVDGPINASWMSVARRNLQGLLEDSPGDSVISMDLVPIPRAYRVNRLILGTSGWVRLHVNDHDVVVGYTASPFLLRVSHAGELLDTIPLLARTRPWVEDEDEFIELADPEKLDPEDTWPMALLVGVSRDDDGYIYTVHEEVRRVGRQVEGKLFVSSLKVGGSEQCSDTPIPVSDLSRAITAFRGNELFVLDRRIGGTGLRTVVRRFAVDPVNCSGEIRMVEGRGDG